MGKKIFAGELSSLPDNLRCRRSDGRKWRCPQPARSGLSYCEYHYHQVHRSQESIKNTNVTAETSVKPKRLLAADPPLPKKRRRRRQRKDPVPVEPIGSEKLKKEVVERKPSDQKVSIDQFSQDLRPSQSVGWEWRCLPLAMPALSSNSCSLRCKHPNEENTELIEPKRKQRLRSAANLLPSLKRRHWRRPRESSEEGPVRSVQREDGEDVMEPAVTKDFPISDQPRRRSSDGRKWRCPQRVIPDLTFCENNLMHSNQTYNKNSKVKIVKLDRGSNLVNDPRRSKKVQRKRLIGEQRAEDLIRTEKNEEALAATKLATPGLSLCHKYLLCCKDHNTTKSAEPAMLSVEATELSAPDVEAAELATPDVEAAESVTPNLCMSDIVLLCRAEEDNKLKEASAKPTRRLHLPSDPQPSKKDFSLSDHLRCRRSDGKKWRCPQLAMPSVGFCEYHLLQMRRNQGKMKNNKLTSIAKRKRGSCRGANPPLARKLRQQRVRGELTGEEPTRRDQKERGERLEAADLEVTRDLPNGVMAISPGTAWIHANASPSVDRKLGPENGYLLGRLFRSKNAERVPLATVQRLPFFRSMGGRRKRVCHRCRTKHIKGAGRILCLRCQEFFCTSCIETWHPELSEFEVKELCPVCRGCCSCINCNSRRDEDGGSKVASCRDISHFE